MKSIAFFLVFCVCFFVRTVHAQVCPAGTTADTLDWSALWNPAWNGTLGPHTMTTPDGIEITFSLSISGAGCSAANLSFGDPFINANILRLAANWPNSNCTLSMQLDFSVGSSINVQNLQFSAQDIDGGGTSSWHDEVVFNGASTVALGASIDPVPDGGNANGPVFCNFASPNCFVTGTWNSPVSSVTFDYQNGPDAPANPGSQVMWLSDVDFCYPDSVPVTLGGFKSTQLGNRISTSWETVSESFNLGFTLWGEMSGKWVALSNDMTRSKTTDTAKTSTYRKSVNVSQFNEEVTALGLSSVDTNGTEEFYGPFEIGKSYGLDSVTEPITWQPIRDAYERRLQSANYEAVGNRWRQRFIGKNEDIKSVSVAIPEEGVYQISHADLLARGVNLSGVPSDEIAVTFQGKPVPRDILKTGRFRQFNSTSSIIFYGAEPTGTDALYIDSLVYQISREPSLVAKAGRVTHRLNPSDELQTLGRSTQHIEEDKFYDEIVTSADPWVMDELFTSASNPSSRSYTFDFNGEVTGEDVDLFLQLNSITDFDEVDQDGDGQVDDEHHIQVIINQQNAGNIVVDETNDGTQSWQITAQFADSLLKQGENTITVLSLNDTGYDFSLVYIDSLAVTLSEKIVVDDNAVKFSGTPKAGGFSVEASLSGRIYGYAYTSDGNLARVRVTKQRVRGQNANHFINISGVSDPSIVASYWVANEQGFLSPSGLWVNDKQSVDIQQKADYLIIIDPALVGSDIERFIQFREESGFDVAMVTVDDIVDEYGYGMKTPDAFSSFLKAAKPSVEFTHVLLVGGHTYDYLNRLKANTAPVNMIPTFYRRSYDLINYSPTDVPFVDFDANGKPDAAIGRWPVRTAEELTTIIDKTIAYEKQGGMADAQSALLIAERNGGGLENFSAQLDRVQPFLGVVAADGSVTPWTAINRVDVDLIETQGFAQGSIANSEARSRLKEGIDAGQSLTIFAGHGSPTRWSNQNLFVWDNVSELENTNAPTQVATLACYTTYYQSPSTNSLAHQFLFDEAGAVSINGASVLGSIRGNEFLLNEALSAMMQGISMGEAVMLAKQKMIDEQRFVDTVLTWVTLGDPALTIRQ